MRKVTRYICELCGATYATEEEARKCETFHAGGEILNYEYIGGSRYPYAGYLGDAIELLVGERRER